jgi:hypothetical protein
MTKGEIIENILKEMRVSASRKRQRSSEEDEEEQNVVTHLEKLLQDAPIETDIRVCADFIDLNVECCGTCHDYVFPYDMSAVIRLKSGEYAWVCCAIGSAIRRTPGAEIPVKHPSPVQPARSAEYRPFADFFRGKVKDNDAK